MCEQQFVLRWHYHESTLLHNFPYFLDTDLLTDVTLSVGPQKVKAHKIILAMCSVYFLQLFQELQTTHPVVVLHNVSFDEVKAILSFMYRGQCVVSQEQLPSLLSVARLLKVQGLCDMKAPERQHHNELNRENIISDERLTNKETSDISNCDYHKLFRKYEHADVINFKRENETEVKMHDLSNESCSSRIPIVFSDDKTTPITTETVASKYKDTPYPFLSKKVTHTQRDFSETCKCFLCGKYLSNQYNLRVHMETHEEAYHACQSCPHVSRSRDALRKHVSYRHPEEYHNRKRKKTDS